MHSFFIEQKRRVTLLVAIALWLWLFPMWGRWVTARPLDEAIALNPRGSISKEIRVVIPENYGLNLVFERGDVASEQLRTLVGDSASRHGKPIRSGVKVPVRWALKTVPEGSIAASGEVDSFGVHAWSGAEVVRRVGRVRVSPGRYLFTAQVLRDVPELARFNTRLSMEIPSKAASTWQVGAVFWGSVINVFVLWPAAIIIVLTLLWRAGSNRLLKRRARSGVFPGSAR